MKRISIQQAANNVVSSNEFGFEDVSSCCGVTDVHGLQAITQSRHFDDDLDDFVSPEALAREVTRVARHEMKQDGKGLAIAYVTDKTSLAYLTANGWRQVDSFRNPSTKNLVYCLNLKPSRSR